MSLDAVRPWYCDSGQAKHGYQYVDMTLRLDIFVESATINTAALVDDHYPHFLAHPLLLSFEDSMIIPHRTPCVNWENARIAIS
jgi:hypothetical protein